MKSSRKKRAKTKVKIKHDKPLESKYFIECPNSTYAEILGMNARDFRNMVITYDLEEQCTATLSVRSRNALRRTEYNTFEKLLLLTPFHLRGIRNLGRKSVIEIEKWIANISKDVPKYISKNIPLTVEQILTYPVRKDILLPIIELMLRGEIYSLDGLTTNEKKIFSKAVEAAELFGNDFCIKLMSGEMNSYINNIVIIFDDFNYRTRALRVLEDARKAVLKWNPEFLPKLIIPYLQLFCISKDENILAKFKDFFEEKVTIGQYVDILANSINSNRKKVVDLAEEFEKFQTWMSEIDIDSICKKVFGQKRKNMFDVVVARATGETLEKIGEQYNVTRERIRQIEKKSLDAVRYQLSKKENNLFLLISAYHNGDRKLSKEKIEEVIGTNYANLLWYCATITKDQGMTHFLDNKIVHYTAAYSAIIVHSDASENYVVNSIDRAKIKGTIDKLPELIETASLQRELNTIAKKSNLPLELFEQAAADQYKGMGKYSYKGTRLTVGQMCDLVLKERFHNGYKIADGASIQLFQKHLIDFFGDAGHLTTRAIDSKITEIGVLINYGKYIHQDYVHINDEIVRNIFNYVESSPKTAITYSEIFLALKKIFKGTIITNSHALHGIIKLYNKKYTIRRNSISKNSEIVVADEFVKFMKLNGIIHKNEIFQEFGWKDYNLSMILLQCPEIIGIGNGYFMHNSKLDIDENISNSIRKYLDNAVRDMPVSVRYLYNYFVVNFTEFMIKNEINDKDKLFSILQYIYGDKYRFSRPYIAKKDTEEITTGKITNTSVLQKYLESIDTIEISDLIHICKKSGIKVISTNYILDMITPEFIRVDDHTLSRFKNIGFSDEMYKDVARLISYAIRANNGYISIRNINDFGWYPIINIPWTQFLLESIAKLIPDINVVKIPATSYKLLQPQAIFVSDKYAHEDWKSLLLKLLKAEHAIEPFITETDIFEWLKKEGLCGSKYPVYLKNENHVFYDDNGKLRIE